VAPVTGARRKGLDPGRVTSLGLLLIFCGFIGAESLPMIRQPALNLRKLLLRLLNHIFNLIF
jgi:hypothetical protein